MDLPAGAEVTAASMPGGTSAASYAVWPWNGFGGGGGGGGGGAVRIVGGGEAVRVATADRPANGTHAWALLTLAPLLPGGWALLGERGKWVGASGRRFSAVSASTAALRLGVRGSAGEVVELDVLDPARGTARTVRVRLGAGGVGTATVARSGGGV